MKKAIVHGNNKSIEINDMFNLRCLLFQIRFAVLLFFAVFSMFGIVYAETKGIQIICMDEDSGAVLDTYHIYGNPYDTTQIQAMDIDGYTVMGDSVKTVVFGIDTDVRYRYNKNPEGSIQFQYHKAYISGFPDHTFRPEKEISWAEALWMLYNVGEHAERTVSPSALWYTPALNYFVQKDFIDTKNNTFDFQEPITKDDFTKLAVVEIDIHADQALINTFLQTDSLDRNTYVTRGDAVWIINKLLKRDLSIHLMPSTRQPYKDVSPGNKLYEAILEASISHDYVIEDQQETWLSVYEE